MDIWDTIEATSSLTALSLAPRYQVVLASPHTGHTHSTVCHWYTLERPTEWVATYTTC